MTATSGRLLKLLSLLQTRRDWPGEELARRLEVSGRTIRRDIERLRDLGYPVDALTGPAGGYRLHAGTAMPPLLLDDDEAVAIAVGLRTAARASVTGIEETSVRALVKLEQVLPSHLRRRVNALQTATVTLATSGPTVDPETLTAIAGASRDRERLRFAYRGRDATESRRCVEPHTLVNLGRRWYLVAWDCDREDWRTFRVDRLEQLSPAGTRFAPRELPEADAAAYVAANLSGAPSRYQARVTLHVPAEEVPQRSLFTGSTVEPIDDRTCELRTSDDSLDWLAVRVAMLGVDFEVHEPHELVERVRELAARFERAASAAR
jgi:predicted DNA-binding transcriptional regulator YafY